MTWFKPFKFKPARFVEQNKVPAIFQMNAVKEKNKSCIKLAKRVALYDRSLVLFGRTILSARVANLVAILKQKGM